jgi:NADH-ubiquinone oxidoreductase chain 1
METQRAPFDLREGERELVSGYNTEYGSLLFVFLFLSEYGNILVLRLVIARV